MIISTLAPIFLIILLGWVLAAKHILPPAFFKGVNTLTFNIGLPALLFVTIATAPMKTSQALRMFYALAATTACLTAIAILLARMLRIHGPLKGSFVQACIRGNLAYIGLPVLMFALESTLPASDATSLQAAAMLALAPTVPLYNLICILILTHSAAEPHERIAAHLLLLKVATNPLLMACVAGLLVACSGIDLPVTLVRTLRPLGQMALPLALLSIGASFTRGGLHHRIGTISLASVVKVGLMPLIGWPIAHAMQLSSAETTVVLLFLACPCAVSGYIMAEQMGGDAEVAGGSILLSTILCLIPFALILLLR